MPARPARTGPRPSAATLATGLSGPRRLRYGPLRDRVLEVRFVTADGRLVKGGGPTVKNVTGYDIPRLLVGSLGTIGVLVQVTLRCQPEPATARWAVTDADPFEAAPADVPPVVHRVGRRARRVCCSRGTPTTSPPRRRPPGSISSTGSRPAARWPDGTHRGRISVRPVAGCATSGPRSTTSTACAGWPRSASAPSTSQPTTPDGLLAARARRGRARRVAVARGGRTRRRRLRRAAAEPRHPRADPRSPSIPPASSHPGGSRSRRAVAAAA